MLGKFLLSRHVSMSAPLITPTYGKIVFVDNHIVMHDCMKAVLDDLFQVFTVCTATEGLEIMKTECAIDIVISSFTLSYSSVNGLEFLRRVGELYPLTLRVLMSGGCGDKVDINLAISAGHINRFVEKPFKPATLREQLKSDLASVRARIK
jgi:response regulator RpfG family c-di-GMP phosphodiesterase